MHLLKQLRRQEIVVHEESGRDNPTITNDEEKLLRELAKGKSNKEIAKALMMSQRSLEYGLRDICQKLYVTSRVEAVKKAKSLGIFSAEDLY